MANKNSIVCSVYATCKHQTILKRVIFAQNAYGQARGVSLTVKKVFVFKLFPSKLQFK